MKRHSNGSTLVYITTTESEILQLEVADYRTLEVQLYIEGGTNSLSSIKLYSKVHKEANWLPMKMGQINTLDNLVLDYYNNPYTLPPNTDGSIILNCDGKGWYKLTATATGKLPLRVYYYLED